MSMTNSSADGRADVPAFNLPGETRLGRVRLQVADLDRSLEYYRLVLGMEAEFLTGTPRSAILRAADGTPLIELAERPGAKPVPPRGRLGLYHYAILLPDRASLARFAGHLAETQVQVGASDHLASEAFYLQDPDGLGIEVYADRPRQTWRYQDGQLAMDTRPLDVRNLMAEAGSQPWAGMPAGATVGHMHLHVGNIGRARKFYQEGVGLDPVVWSYPGALFLSAGGYHHHLGVNTWAAGAQPAGPEDARLVDWELVLPGAVDLAEATDNLRSHGFPVADEGAAQVVVDPWGVTLRLVISSD
jgi:catechol 2,3-dioxygenase